MVDILEIRSEIQATEQPFLAVDIDETLSETLAYYVAGLQQLLGNPEQLSTRQMIEKYKYSVDVPYWDEEKIGPWIEAQRNSNEAQRSMDVIEDSSAFLTEISTIIPIFYMTARPAGVEEGTRDWLARHNFPAGRIVTRPSHVPFEKTSAWKAEVIADLYPHIIGIIDDNPALPAALPTTYQGTVFFYGRRAFTCERTDIHVVPCLTWKESFHQMKQVIIEVLERLQTGPRH